MNVLAYVQLRSIHAPTGHGRRARVLTESLARRADTSLRVLVDRRDHTLHMGALGQPWTGFDYEYFDRDTSTQQALWAAVHRPRAEQFWPETQVIFCTNESYVPTKSAALIGSLHDAAVLEEDLHRSAHRGRLRRAKTARLFRLLAKRATVVVVPSLFSAARVLHFAPRLEGRLCVVPCAAGPRFLTPVTSVGERARARLVPQGSRYVLVPGGLWARKNAALILAAWPNILAKVPDLSLIVAGNCDKKFAAQARGLSGSIVLAGYVDEETLCSLYHGAAVTWFPSRYEGFGMPVLEAMACNSPVVSSATSAIPEVAGDAALLISPDSEKEHVEAVTQLLENGTLRSKLIERGLARAKAYEWDRSAATLRMAFEGHADLI